MKFRNMRRFKQEISKEECIKILEHGSSGVLAVLGDGDYPYAVPLSYVYENGKIYFHCAKSGHKLDAIQRNNKVSFCVVGQDQVVPQEYTSYFKSVIVFGTVRILEEKEEIWTAIEKLAVKYHPGDTPQNRKTAIQQSFSPLCMLELTIEHMTGKEAKELVRQR